MKKFEYKLLTISASQLGREKFREELDHKFQVWGNQGWDLIKMEPITSGALFFQGATTREFFVVFKREKVDDSRY